MQVVALQRRLGWFASLTPLATIRRASLARRSLALCRRRTACPETCACWNARGRKPEARESGSSSRLGRRLFRGVSECGVSLFRAGVVCGGCSPTRRAASASAWLTRGTLCPRASPSWSSSTCDGRFLAPSDATTQWSVWPSILQVPGQALSRQRLQMYVVWWCAVFHSLIRAHDAPV